MEARAPYLAALLGAPARVLPRSGRLGRRRPGRRALPPRAPRAQPRRRPPLPRRRRRRRRHDASRGGAPAAAFDDRWAPSTGPEPSCCWPTSPPTPPTPPTSPRPPPVWPHDGCPAWSTSWSAPAARWPGVPSPSAGRRRRRGPRRRRADVARAATPPPRRPGAGAAAFLTGPAMPTSWPRPNAGSARPRPRPGRPMPPWPPPRRRLRITRPRCRRRSPFAAATSSPMPCRPAGVAAGRRGRTGGCTPRRPCRRRPRAPGPGLRKVATYAERSRLAGAERIEDILTPDPLSEGLMRHRIAVLDDLGPGLAAGVEAGVDLGL